MYVAQQITNSLYFVFHYLFRESFFLKALVVHIQIKDKMGKINNSFKILGINQILSSHIPRNLKRFPMKPNIGIATFLGIQIVRNHIFRNLDARSNVDSLVPNATLEFRYSLFYD